MSCQLRYSRTPSAKTAVTRLPISCTRPGADEVADAFRVVHDARDEHAGLRRVEVADRQAHHVLLDPAPHVGDGLLRGDAEDLRQAERRHACTTVAAPAAQASVGSSSDPAVLR